MRRSFVDMRPGYLFILAVLWLIVALLFASESYLSGLYRGRPVEFVPTLGDSLAYYGAGESAEDTHIAVARSRRWHCYPG